MNQEELTKKLLNALDNAQKAEPSEAFIQKMEKLALANISKNAKFSKSILWSIAASFLLLVASNVMVLSQLDNTDLDAEESAESNYDLIPAKSIYNE